MKLIYVIPLIGAVLGLPQSSAPAACTSPKVRKSWDSATHTEKRAYLDAAVCLTEAATRLENSATDKLQDDLQFVHAKLDVKIHQLAAFLPWHRFFVQVYEDALRNDCGYAGPMMYWDWVGDSFAPLEASVWDPDTGFGGNGVVTPDSGGNKCVVDGPFTDYRPAYRASPSPDPHCLSRDFLPASQSDDGELNRDGYTPQVFADVMSKTVYDIFRNHLENGPHAKIHAGVRGDGLTPNDPLFFLHHAQVDRIWWLWQQEDPTRTLLYEALPGATPVSLDDSMPMDGVAPDGIVRDYMDTQGGVLCYTYQ